MSHMGEGEVKMINSGKVPSLGNLQDRLPTSRSVSEPPLPKSAALAEPRLVLGNGLSYVGLFR